MVNIMPINKKIVQLTVKKTAGKIRCSILAAQQLQ